VQSALQSPRARAVLDRLHAAAAVEDIAAADRVRSAEAQAGTRLEQPERYELYGDAPLAIKPPVGELLYALVRARRPFRAVEFGTSHGLSTVYLAAALEDCGRGALITTEQLSSKAETARRNLDDAGLGERVKIRVGDARETLAGIAGTIDFLFLDGRNDLYLTILGLLEPCLTSDALVAADLSADDPDLLPYIDHVRAPSSGYVSVSLPLDAGLEISMRTGGTARS
jgi:predicted O-methyltransferase YrrM